MPPRWVEEVAGGLRGGGVEEGLHAHVARVAHVRAVVGVRRMRHAHGWAARVRALGRGCTRARPISWASARVSRGGDAELRDFLRRAREWVARAGMRQRARESAPGTSASDSKRRFMVVDIFLGLRSRGILCVTVHSFVRVSTPHEAPCLKRPYSTPERESHATSCMRAWRARDRGGPQSTSPLRSLDSNAWTKAQ